MPDITMCTGVENGKDDIYVYCPLKDTCHRYKAEPALHGQSWFDPLQYRDGQCNYYMEEHV